MTEMIDVYDSKGALTGKVVPRFERLSDDERAMYVLAIIQDAQGRYLITQRSQDKHWAAGWWEVTGGGVSAGETVEVAVTREVAEEVGLTVPDPLPAPIWRYESTDFERGDNYFVNIYNFVIDFDLNDVKLQESEAVDCRLVTWDEIKELNEQGIFLHFSRIETALAAKA